MHRSFFSFLFFLCFSFAVKAQQNAVTSVNGTGNYQQGGQDSSLFRSITSADLPKSLPVPAPDSSISKTKEQGKPLKKAEYDVKGLPPKKN